MKSGGGDMTLRHRIWLSLALLAVATALMIAALFPWGASIQNARLASAGGILYWVAIMLAMSWWRCPVCGRRIDPPFFKKKSCRHCGREIDWDAKPRKGSKG